MVRRGRASSRTSSCTHISRQAIVNLIGSTTTRNGLRIRADIDENTYAKGIKISDAELAALAIERDKFHGEWNYRVPPRDYRE